MDPRGTSAQLGTNIEEKQPQQPTVASELLQLTLEELYYKLHDEIKPFFNQVASTHLERWDEDKHESQAPPIYYKKTYFNQNPDILGLLERRSNVTVVLPKGKNKFKHARHDDDEFLNELLMTLKNSSLTDENSQLVKVFLFVREWFIEIAKIQSKIDNLNGVQDQDEISSRKDLIVRTLPRVADELNIEKSKLILLSRYPQLNESVKLLEFSIEALKDIAELVQKSDLKALHNIDLHRPLYQSNPPPWWQRHWKPIAITAGILLAGLTIGSLGAAGFVVGGVFGGFVTIGSLMTGGAVAGAGAGVLAGAATALGGVAVFTPWLDGIRRFASDVNWKRIALSAFVATVVIAATIAGLGIGGVIAGGAIGGFVVAGSLVSGGALSGVGAALTGVLVTLGLGAITSPLSYSYKNAISNIISFGKKIAAIFSAPPLPPPPSASVGSESKPGGDAGDSFVPGPGNTLTFGPQVTQTNITTTPSPTTSVSTKTTPSLESGAAAAAASKETVVPGTALTLTTATSDVAPPSPPRNVQTNMKKM